MRRTVLLAACFLAASLATLGVTVTSAAPAHPRPAQVTAGPYAAGRDSTCVDLPGHHAYSCILAEQGFQYWGDWALANAFYWHPHPFTDYGVVDVYFKDMMPGQAHPVPSWMHRVLVLPGGFIPLNYDVPSSASSAPAPVNCTVANDITVAGVSYVAGTSFPCPAIVVTSVEDWWDNYGVHIPTYDW